MILVFFFLFQLGTRGWEDSLASASLGIPAAFPQHFGAQWSPRKFADNEPSGKRFRGPAQWKHAFYKPNATLNAPLNVVEWQVLVSPRKTHWINTFREPTLREDRLASTCEFDLIMALLSRQVYPWIFANHERVRLLLCRQYRGRSREIFGILQNSKKVRNIK